MTWVGGMEGRHLLCVYPMGSLICYSNLMEIFCLRYDSILQSSWKECILKKHALVLILRYVKYVLIPLSMNFEEYPQTLKNLSFHSMETVCGKWRLLQQPNWHSNIHLVWGMIYYYHFLCQETRKKSMSWLYFCCWWSIHMYIHMKHSYVHMEEATFEPSA